MLTGWRIRTKKQGAAVKAVVKEGPREGAKSPRTAPSVST